MTSPVQRAVDHYHELLSDELAGESQAALEGELRRRGLFFGDRALCTRYSQGMVELANEYSSLLSAKK